MGVDSSAGTGIRLVHLDLLDPGQDALAREWAAVQEVSERAEFGDREASWTLPELRGMAADQTDEQRVDVAALVDDRVVGSIGIRIHLQDNKHRLEHSLHVHPDARRRGIGSALLRECERVAQAEGRSVIGAEAQETLASSGGATAFALGQGYAAANFELRSDLDLGPGLSDRLTEVEREVDDHIEGYAVESVTGALPASWLADQAELERQLSTDIPMGEVDIEEQMWDAARVERQVRGDLATGRTRFESVARHIASGRLVAFTVIQGPRDGAGAAYQWATQVSEEHRGHRLGLAIKAANLRRLIAEQPGVRRVCTWNAEDNEPMLRVNRALGFAPQGRLTEWQKTLA
jgi:GNAT superfamily N-acetyltransferase